MTGTRDVGRRTSDVGRDIGNARLLPEPGSPLVLAVSGGADSMALWAWCAEVGRWPLTIFHLDHGLRADSAADANFVRAMAARLGGTVVIERVDLASATAGVGIEAAGRRERYARLLSCARAVGAGVIATGHHRDDQAETVLFNLLRGSGPVGLMGIARRRHLADDVVVVRPLLGRSRAEIQDWLRARGLSWREDPSNADPRFSRNRIRHRLLPAFNAILPDAARHWARFADHVRRRTRAQRSAARAAYLAARADDHLRLADLIALDPATRLLVWRRLVKDLGADLQRRHLDHLDDLALGDVGRRWHLGRLLFLRQADRLSWADAEPVALPADLAIDGAGTYAFGPGVLVILPGEVGEPHLPKDEACIDRAQIRGALILRAPRPGERWRPLGAPGHQGLRQTLAARGVPSQFREVTPVVADAEGAVWIPGVGIADRVKVTATTTAAWHLRWSAAAPG